MEKEAQVITNYDDVLRRVKEACLRSSRNPEAVRILTVTKYALEQDIYTLLKHRSINVVGESRLQDSIKKWSCGNLAEFNPAKFFIGRLQTNKAAKVIENFDVICSLDSLHLADALEAQAQKRGKTVKCLVQVKLTDKETQGGITLREAQVLIDSVRKSCTHINLAGIMAIAPIAREKEELRPLFKKVKNLFDVNFKEGEILSLGMSEDFETAVEEGSNLPRIGSAIFKQI